MLLQLVMDIGAEDFFSVLVAAASSPAKWGSADLRWENKRRRRRRRRKRRKGGGERDIDGLVDGSIGSLVHWLWLLSIIGGRFCCGVG